MGRTFFFFTQPGVSNLTFPCTTIEGGRDPGKPCVFPINYYGQICDQCCLMDTELPACGTQLYAEGEELYDHFGYCSSDCKGEIPGPSSKFNLATEKFHNLWNSDFYDLRSFENGYCHTYDPPIKSLPGFRHRLYFLISTLDDAYNKDFDIFLHEKGQFWPRSDMFTLGQPEPIKVSKGDDIKIVFTIKEIENLNQDSRLCTEEADFSFTKCILKFIEDESGCQNLICPEENFVKYFDLLIWIKQATLSSVMNRSGCQQKCKKTQYLIEIEKNSITWNSSWSSEVYIQPQSSTVEKSSEYYSFDKNDLISSLGGYLGLFLGWSLLTFFEAIPYILWLLRRGRKEKAVTYP